jgi:hypothetical protein
LRAITVLGRHDDAERHLPMAVIARNVGAVVTG